RTAGVAKRTDAWVLSDRDAVRVLVCLSNDRPRFRDVVEGTGLDKAACLRLLKRLRRDQVVGRRQVGRHGVYALTRRGRSLWEAVYRTLLIAEAAQGIDVQVEAASVPEPSQAVQGEVAEIPDVPISRVVDFARLIKGERFVCALVAISAGPMSPRQISTAIDVKTSILSSYLRTLRLTGLIDGKATDNPPIYSITPKGRKLASALIECAAG
ncbi:winged helix-turn-helix transcriptional regulator, partial [Paludisphaera rhizosphaerae]|uniref:winged helix-turn-helix transcriptional regulator n=1 Tax=Paludisphaera rhizosphaerae TaxID=2711216 RepID=UPI00197D6119